MALNKPYDVIVVGAGISGLLSALALGKEGKSVLVIERSKWVGGNCRTYEVEDTGFFVDTGVHAITGLNNGPLVQLMDRYFDILPKFIPHGNYYVREKHGLKKFPNTLQDIARFDGIPRKDRMILTKCMIEAIANNAVFRKNDISVYDHISKYSLSENTLKFLDAMSYFLSGVSMKKTPVWRILSGGGLIDEYGEHKMRKKISDFVRLALNSSYAEQGYPRGGIGSITKCLIQSLPKNVEIKTGENVKKIEKKDDEMFIVMSSKKYVCKQIVYSGEAKKLPELIRMPKEWETSAKEMLQSKAMTIWLGLKKPIDALNYRGSEVWFHQGIPYWAMPTSGYDLGLAPKGKLIAGFAAFIPENEEQKTYEKKFLETIYLAVPELEKNVEMKHVQVIVPEKAAVSVGIKFPSVSTPINNLYIVGTDADMRSMGITRASYSVIEMLKAMGISTMT